VAKIVKIKCNGAEQHINVIDLDHALELSGPDHSTAKINH
jgi:hypothetical protein